MKTWLVTVPIRGYATYRIEAESAEMAKWGLAGMQGELVAEVGEWDSDDEWECEVIGPDHRHYTGSIPEDVK